MLKLVQGKVTSNEDATRSGKILAHFFEISDVPISVFYTSQGYRAGGGGMFAVPEKGDNIIAIYDTISNNAYYSTTIIGLPSPTVGPLPQFRDVPDVNTYNAYSKPVKVKYENQKGSGLCITSDYTSFPSEVGPSPEPRIVDSVVLKSPLNKRLSLNDSPKTDRDWETMCSRW